MIDPALASGLVAGCFQKSQTLGLRYRPLKDRVPMNRMISLAERESLTQKTPLVLTGILLIREGIYKEQ